VQYGIEQQKNCRFGRVVCVEHEQSFLPENQPQLLPAVRLQYVEEVIFTVRNSHLALHPEYVSDWTMLPSDYGRYKFVFTIQNSDVSELCILNLYRIGQCLIRWGERKSYQNPNTPQLSESLILLYG
jgi:hypothetical protein